MSKINFKKTLEKCDAFIYEPVLETVLPYGEWIDSKEKCLDCVNTLNTLTVKVLGDNAIFVQPCITYTKLFKQLQDLMGDAIVYYLDKEVAMLIVKDTPIAREAFKSLENKSLGILI